jgi:hypothetical protein
MHPGCRLQHQTTETGKHKGGDSIMKKCFLGVLLALCFAIPAIAEEITLPKDITVGKYIAHVGAGGTVSIDSNGYRLLETMPVTFYTIIDRQWGLVYGGAASMSAVMEKDADGRTVVTFTGKKPGAINFTEKITFGTGEVEIIYDYEILKKIPNMNCDMTIKLPEIAYAGADYKAVERGGAKTGKLPADKPKSTVLRYDDWNYLRNLQIESKAGPVNFALSNHNWSLSDSRSDNRLKSYCLWAICPTSVGNKTLKINLKL